MPCNGVMYTCTCMLVQVYFTNYCKVEAHLSFPTCPELVRVREKEWVGMEGITKSGWSEEEHHK